MKKYILIFLSFFWLLIGQEKPSNLQIAKKLEIKTKFERVTKTHEFPKPYRELDSLLQIIYDQYCNYPGMTKRDQNSNYVRWEHTDISYDLLKDFASVLLKIQFYPWELYHNYVTIANEPIKDQQRRFNELIKKGGYWSELILPLPGWIIHHYILNTQIKNRFPRDFNLIINNRYILIVEPYLYERDWVNPDIKIQKINYYGCKVISDIKGNYMGDEKIEVCVGDNLMGYSTLDIGSRYMVLLRHKSQYIHFNDLNQSYILNPSDTDRFGIFKIEGNYINNLEIVLQSNSKIEIEYFKQVVERIINDTME
ncbi:MAG: hypothetical protein ACP5FZ_08910 [Fidelibacterota bacterium]